MHLIYVAGGLYSETGKNLYWDQIVDFDYYFFVGFKAWDSVES